MAPPLFLTRLMSKSNPRRIKHSTNSSSSSSNGTFLSRAIRLSFLLCFLTALYLIACTLQSVLLTTTTLAGDNLLPTPWHPFASDSRLKLSRAPRLLHCSYLSCAMATSTTPPRTGITALNSSRSAQCPQFFQWIHRDLSPWRATGITRPMLDRARRFAAFRVVIVDGKLYTNLYYQCVQSRAMFTIWGLLMLLEKYPGLIPDVDFMFNCMDRPHFFAADFHRRTPPPLFAYCTTEDSFDIPFPDWSYWGWAEVNIGPWNEEADSIFERAEPRRWMDKQPRAYWKGNPNVGAQVRTDLLACNRSGSHDFGADIYHQNWLAESQEGYKNSKLSSQCGHRYKLYAEGHAWSVSFKYIMACGSTLLLINPDYYDFFMRGLLSREHYWPIDRDNICPSIEHAVVWGNSHNREAERIGRHAQDFLRKNLSMDRVYDYMLHLLREYAKLQRFKPTVPEGAQRVCKESVLCIAEPLHRKYLERSLNHRHSKPVFPCRLPAADTTYIDKLNLQNSEKFKAVQEIVQSNTVLKSEKPKQASKKQTGKNNKKRKNPVTFL